MTHLGQSPGWASPRWAIREVELHSGEAIEGRARSAEDVRMGHVVWSIRSGGVGEFDAPEILGGYRSANPIHEPKLGEVLRLPDHSGSWRVVDWRVTRRSDSPQNVLLVEPATG